MYCEIYLIDVPYHIDRPFDYEVPESLLPRVKRGALVRVPFGRANRLRVGVVVSVGKELTDIKTKPVHSVLDDRFSLSEEMLGLCLFLKEYTLCTFGEAVRTALPPGAFSENLNIKYSRTCILNVDESELASHLSGEIKPKLRSEGQKSVLRYLSGIKSADYSLVTALPGVDSTHIRALEKRGLIRISESESIRNPYAAYAKERDTAEIALSRAQSAAYERIESLCDSDKAEAVLLYGVTGSGKTKVIMKTIDKVIADGKTVIMMVPEISLTPQTVGIFCKRYGERVAVIHSALSQGERLDAWRRIKRGDVDLVIGTRSAAFAPLENIGMIVIDEEQEHAYKSESNPKYHAKDIAAYRCGKHNALMLLASATPSVESFYKAKCGIYNLVTLKERYGGVRLPDAVIVDMREELRLGNTSPVSDRLARSLESVREAGEQAILFLNRRGYSSQISCKNCGEVITCPRCSVSLTHHTDKSGGKLLCHLCGYSQGVPRTCHTCQSDKLSYLGFGTQKVEGEMEKYFPDMTLMRMDADTTGGKLDYDRMTEAFRRGEADILLGTQMVAKGHDFPRVTLVGVMLADTSLYVSDFRAAERTFSLLTQVIGRAGRAADKGVAVIQTYSPSNDIIRLACSQDYDKFYEAEIALRKELSYPPFCDIVQLTLTSEDEKALFGATKALADSVKAKLSGEYSKLPFLVFGPFEAQVYKLNQKYRMRMVIKCRLNKESRSLFHKLLCEFSDVRGVTLAVDLNPLSV
ncbi:MAG: primosomal protein N' [Clostridia bacterium]|nr:primosomal protein N' [Clostridia bacterium]